MALRRRPRIAVVSLLIIGCAASVSAIAGAPPAALAARRQVVTLPPELAQLPFAPEWQGVGVISEPDAWPDPAANMGKGVTMQFEWVPVAPAASLDEPYNQPNDAELFVVWDGEVVIATAEGEARYLPGDQFLSQASDYAIRNETRTCASVLRLSFGVPAMADISMQPSDGDLLVPTTECGEPSALLAWHGQSWPAAPGVLVMGVVRFGAGEDVAPARYSGPLGLLGASGKLTVGLEAEGEFFLNEGDWIVVAPGSEQWVRNDEPTAGEAYVVGVLAADSATSSVATNATRPR